MKAVVSTTYDDKYLFFLPIITWCWNKLGVDVICFMPSPRSFTVYKEGIASGIELDNDTRVNLIISTVIDKKLNLTLPRFKCPEHKEATYAQCSRLYAAATKDLQDDEVIITGDIDMGMFKIPPHDGSITIFGSDLVPDNQYPMCYASGTVKQWTEVIGEATYQEHLDNLLGHIEAQHFRGNYWGKDQETLFNLLQSHNHKLILRARPRTQFAANRIDRDDSFWEERLNWDVIDAHLWRPGYTDENFPKILKLIKYFYPHEDLTWLENYRNEYLKLL